MSQFMADLVNSKHSYMSKNPIEISFPSIEFERGQIGAMYLVENHSDDYNHAMKCIHGFANTISIIASSINPLVVAWKKGGFTNIDS